MKTIKKLPFLLSLLSFLTIFTPANAEIKVVATIKPIHSLASYLMDGVGKPDLIVEKLYRQHQKLFGFFHHLNYLVLKIVSYSQTI